METTKRKTESQTKENWMMAKRQAKQMGIVHCELYILIEKGEKSLFGAIFLFLFAYMPKKSYLCSRIATTSKNSSQ